MLNYQDIKIFNKNGYEIPLVSTSNIMFTTANNLDMISDNDILLYGYYDNVDKTKFSTKTIKPGKLNKDSYNTAILSGIKLYAFVDEKLVNETTVLLSENNFIKLYYTDNTEYNYSDDTLIANGKDEFLYYTLDTNICIDININLSHNKNGDEINNNTGDVSDDTTNNSAKTGDESQVTVCFLVMGIMLLGICALHRAGKREVR